MAQAIPMVADIVTTLKAAHAPEVVAIVTAHHFATSLMDHFGRKHKTSLEASIHLIDRMTAEYVKLRGYDVRTILEARWDIVSAARQAQSLPE